MLISLNLEYYHNLYFCNTVFFLLLDVNMNGRVEGDRKGKQQRIRTISYDSSEI